MNDFTYAQVPDLDPILFAELIDEHAADIVARLNDEDLPRAAPLPG